MPDLVVDAGRESAPAGLVAVGDSGPGSKGRRGAGGPRCDRAARLLNGSGKFVLRASLSAYAGTWRLPFSSLQNAHLPTGVMGSGLDPDCGIRWPSQPTTRP